MTGARFDPNASILWSGFHTIGRYYGIGQQREEINGSTQLPQL